MHLVEKGKNQSIVMNAREVACLLAFSSKDEKVPTHHGAVIVLHDSTLSAYATDGKKSVRGVRKLDPGFTWERYEWLIPRGDLIMVGSVLSDGQEAHFPLHGSRCAINGVERWSIETGGEDVKLDWHQFGQPVPANSQVDLPYSKVDTLADGERDGAGVIPTFSADTGSALKKLALAGLTPNYALSIAGSGLLHATTDGGTVWHAVFSPVDPDSTPDEPEDDESLDEDGNLQLSTPKKPKRRSRKAKS